MPLSGAWRLRFKGRHKAGTWAAAHSVKGWPARGFCVPGQGAGAGDFGSGSSARKGHSSRFTVWSFQENQDKFGFISLGFSLGRPLYVLGLPWLTVPPENSLGPECEAIAAAGSILQPVGLAFLSSATKWVTLGTPPQGLLEHPV